MSLKGQSRMCGAASGRAGESERTFIHSKTSRAAPPPRPPLTSLSDVSAAEWRGGTGGGTSGTKGEEEREGGGEKKATERERAAKQK